MERWTKKRLSWFKRLKGRVEFVDADGWSLQFRNLTPFGRYYVEVCEVYRFGVLLATLDPARPEVYPTFYTERYVQASLMALASYQEEKKQRGLDAMRRAKEEAQSKRLLNDQLVDKLTSYNSGEAKC